MPSISIIGTGNIGSSLARVFARSRVDAMIANTRGPDSFRELAAEIAPTVRAVTVGEARKADVLFLAIPFLATGPFGASQPEWSGKIIVDTTNSFYLPNEDEVLAGRLSTEVLTDAFPGAAVVKAFNQLPASVLSRQLPAEAGKIVIFIASNSDSASRDISQIAEMLGYSPVELGRVDDGGRLIQARNALVLRLFTEHPMD
ncbi:MAG: NADPH-dependent F420 reductase [Candidatus Dormibacteria bacterium]